MVEEEKMLVRLLGDSSQYTDMLKKAVGDSKSSVEEISRAGDKIEGFAEVVKDASNQVQSALEGIGINEWFKGVNTNVGTASESVRTGMNNIQMEAAKLSSGIGELTNKVVKYVAALGALSAAYVALTKVQAAFGLTSIATTFEKTWTSALVAVTGAINVLTTATKLATTAMVTFAVTNPVGFVAATAGVIVTLKLMSDAFRQYRADVADTDKAIEKSNATHKKRMESLDKETQSSLDWVNSFTSLNDRIDVVNSRLERLRDKDPEIEQMSFKEQEKARKELIAKRRMELINSGVSIQDVEYLDPQIKMEAHNEMKRREAVAMASAEDAKGLLTKKRDEIDKLKREIEESQTAGGFTTGTRYTPGRSDKVYDRPLSSILANRLGIGDEYKQLANDLKNAEEEYAKLQKRHDGYIDSVKTDDAALQGIKDYEAHLEKVAKGWELTGKQAHIAKMETDIKQNEAVADFLQEQADETFDLDMMDRANEAYEKVAKAKESLIRIKELSLQEDQIKATASVDAMNESLKRQVDVLKKGEDAVALWEMEWKLLESGIPVEEVDMMTRKIEEQQEEVKKLREFKGMQQEAEQLYQNSLSPDQKHQQKLQRLDELFQRGAFGEELDDTARNKYESALKKIQDEFDATKNKTKEAREEIKRFDAALLGSAEAASRIDDYVNKLNERQRVPGLGGGDGGKVSRKVTPAVNPKLVEPNPDREETRPLFDSPKDLEVLGEIRDVLVQMRDERDKGLEIGTVDMESTA